jgi:hypothetical protein
MALAGIYYYYYYYYRKRAKHDVLRLRRGGNSHSPTSTDAASDILIFTIKQCVPRKVCGEKINVSKHEARLIIKNLLPPFRIFFTFDGALMEKYWFLTLRGCNRRSRLPYVPHATTRFQSRCFRGTRIHRSITGIRSASGDAATVYQIFFSFRFFMVCRCWFYQFWLYAWNFFFLFCHQIKFLKIFTGLKLKLNYLKYKN